MNLAQTFGANSIEVLALEYLLAERKTTDGMQYVAARCGSSRSALYRRFPSWQLLVSWVHQRIIRFIDLDVSPREPDRRFVFESWWSWTIQFLRDRHGVALRRIRPAVAADHGCEMVERAEITLMPKFACWVARRSNPSDADLVTAFAVWTLAVGAASSPRGSRAEARAFNLAWGHIAEADAQPLDDELDFQNVSALGEPLLSGVDSE
jgi:AcrR family transcriptional regulator